MAKLLKNIITAVIFLIITYLIFAVLLSVLPTHTETESCLVDKEIYITTNGVHLDIIIPSENIEYHLLTKMDISDNAGFIGFGWGDKEFYIKTPYWSDLKFNIAFNALFLKSQSAMHITYYTSEYYKWKKILICREQLVKLTNYIENSFKTDEYGQFIRLSFPGYTDHDTFYEGKNSFSLFRTCNVWVSNGLKEAGIKTSVWSPFDFGVLYHLE